MSLLDDCRRLNIPVTPEMLKYIKAYDFNENGVRDKMERLYPFLKNPPVIGRSLSESEQQQLQQLADEFNGSLGRKYDAKDITD